MKTKKRSPFLLAPLAVSLLAVSIANISFAKTNQNTVINGFNQNRYINNLDAGFQFQALKSDEFIMHRLNNRPRKTLGMKTPNEVLFEELQAVALAS